MDSAAEIERIEKEKTYLEGFVESVRKKLSNERFVANAKPEVVAIERQKEADALFKIESLTRQLLEWAKGSAEKS
jgi:valyl-tRNA synthetase